MSDIEKLKTDLDEFWIPDIYRDRVRSKRTRSFAMNIPERENSPEIMHTLLGIELKIGKLRLPMPDLATARYVRVFARLGCREVAVPYDISKISGIADLLETGWQRMNLLLQESTTRARNSAIKSIRAAIAEIGAGDVMPEFNTETKQRTK